VRVGRPWIFELYPRDIVGDVVRRGLDFTRYRFVVLCFFFDLDLLDEGENYQEATFGADFEDQDVVALELFPAVVTEKVQVESGRGVDFVPLAEFAGLSLQFGGIRHERRISFARIDPVIGSHGRGSGRFRWHFSAHPAVPLFPSDRSVAAVVQLPRDVEVFHGTITCQATVRRRIAGVRHARTRRRACGQEHVGRGGDGGIRGVEGP
jgi:hypothetical protein